MMEILSFFVAIVLVIFIIGSGLMAVVALFNKKPKEAAVYGLLFVAAAFLFGIGMERLR